MCSCGVPEAHFHRPGCDLKVFPIDGGPDMTPAQAHVLNKIYRRDYRRAVLQMTHLRDTPLEVETYSTWEDHVTAREVYADAASRPAYYRHQGFELPPSAEGVLLDGDVRVYDCACNCGGRVLVSGPYAVLRGPPEAGWWITEHAPRGISHHGPRFKQRALA